MRRQDYLAGPLLLCPAACAAAGPIAERAVAGPTKPVDLKSRLGLRYRQNRYENRFERNCEGVTAR